MTNGTRATAATPTQSAARKPSWTSAGKLLIVIAFHGRNALGRRTARRGSISVEKNKAASAYADRDAVDGVTLRIRAAARTFPTELPDQRAIAARWRARPSFVTSTALQAMTGTAP
jgi:hypothetical protein